MTSPEINHRVSQLRHDVDDVYELLDKTNESVVDIRQVVGTLAMTQRRHGNRLEEIQSAQDLAVGRLSRLEEGQLAHSGRFDQLDTKVGDLDTKFGDLDTKVSGITTQVGGLASVVQDHGTKLDTILSLLQRDRPADS